ncbi:MAG: cysteine desulfurase [Acetatifactor sp.]|nr:cysteine desulfurase [Acetatifactor sp.]
MRKPIYLDHAASTPLSPDVKKYIISLLDTYGNPSSSHSQGAEARKIIENARSRVADFLNMDDKNDLSQKILFTSSGSAANSLAVKGLTSENPEQNQYEVFYSPTAHKSMLRACETCLYHMPLQVNFYGEIDLQCLDDLLYHHNMLKPLVCIEAANSEIGAINNVARIGSIVHKYGGILLVDVTGYIPSIRVNMAHWKNHVDILTFSGHKLHALKGVGVLYKRKDLQLNPLIYGSQEQGLFAGTENFLGIASLGKAVESYDYSSISSKKRDYLINSILLNISDCYLIGSRENRLPHNIYLCFKGIEGEALMILLDMKDIQVSTGSACSGGDLTPSPALLSIGLPDEDIHSCIRITLSGNETYKELDYVINTIKKCVDNLKALR